MTETPTEAATATAAVAAPPPDLRLDRRQEVFRVAGELYRQTPDWVVFFREILGLDGIVRRMFKTAEELTAFEKTAEYEEIQHMIAKLRERTTVQTDEKEPTRVITVRLPKSLHESLRTEAHERRTSMNKLCISKLLQVIDDEMVPSE
jgi:predicted HicB family RNase H-like nuclease